MESCQGCGTGTDAIDTTVEVADTVIHFIHSRADVIDGAVELAFIDGIRRFRGIADILDSVAAHADVVVLDSDVLRRIFVYNLETVVVDRRVARRYGAGIHRIAFDDRLVVPGTDGNLIVDFNIVHFNTVETL